MVAEGVVAGRGGDALRDGDLFGGGVIGDADVDGVGGKVVDADGGVALVPGYAERGVAVGDQVVDECVGEGWGEEGLAWLVGFYDLGRWWERETLDETALAGSSIADSEQYGGVRWADAPIVDGCWLDSGDGCD